MTAALRRGDALALRGMKNLETFRRVLQMLVTTAGIRFTLDPETDPRFRDYFAAGLFGAVEGATTGGLLGLAIGVLAEDPDLATLGALLGGLIGHTAGMKSVRSGWRVRATWALDQSPELFVQPI